ncbi:MAG: DUF3352 domain-containing protein [Leptolyngbyaceae cyanobacterium]
MKSRTFYSAIALFSGLIVLIGVVGFWGLTAENPRTLITEGGQTAPTAAQFVPRQSPLMASLLARPDRLWKLRQLLAPANQRATARREWRSLQQLLEDATGWDYEADIQPWLDQEITLAITSLDLDHDDKNGLQAGYLVTLNCHDADAAREALHLLWQKRVAQGRNLVFETVSGVGLIFDQPLSILSSPQVSLAAAKPTVASLATAFVGDRYVLLANDVQVLRQAIATYQAPDVSLAKAAAYREAIATLHQNRIGWLYANIPTLLSWLGTEDRCPSPIKPAGQDANSLFVSVQAVASGITGQLAIAPSPDSWTQIEPTPAEAATQSASSTLDLVPDDALFTISGQRFKEGLQRLQTDIGGYKATQAVLSTLSTPPLARDKPNYQIGQQLLSRLQGSYALSLLPGQSTSWLLMSMVDDFTEFDELATAQGLSVNQIPFEGKTMTAWTRFSFNRAVVEAPLTLSTQVVAIHTNLNGYEVVSTSLSGLERVLEQAESDALSQKTSLLQLAAHTGPAASNLAYVNWPALAPVLINRFPWLKAVELAGEPLTGHIGPLLVSGAEDSESLRISNFAVKLEEDPTKVS